MEIKFSNNQRASVLCCLRVLLGHGADGVTNSLDSSTEAIHSIFAEARWSYAVCLCGFILFLLLKHVLEIVCCIKVQYLVEGKRFNPLM